MVYIIKFFDKMYFKYLLILPLSSKKKKKKESLCQNIWVLCDRIAFIHCEKPDQPARA